MVTTEGRKVSMEGTYVELMEDLMNIVASYFRTSEIDIDDAEKAIEVGIKVGMEDRNV